MVEITDSGSLEAWLEGQPREVAVAIAVRAALRVVPLLSQIDKQIPEETPWDEITLSVMRCNLAAAVVMVHSTTATMKSADAAAEVAFSSSPGSAFVANVTSAAVCAAYSKSSTANIANTANAAGYSAHAVSDNEAIIWSSVSRDLGVVVSHEDISELWYTRLWHFVGVPNELSVDLELFMARLESKPSVWAFWSRWYKRALSGEWMNWEMQREIALLPDADWAQGPGHIAGLIAEIEARYLAAATPVAEELRVREETGKVYAVPAPMEDGEHYEIILETVEEALDDATRQSNNALSEHDFEVSVLRRALTKHRAKPYRVHQDLLIVRDNLKARVDVGYLPPDHPPIENLVRVIDDAALNIRRAIPKVRETVSANLVLRYEEAGDNDKQNISLAVDVFIAIAEADLVEDVEEDRAEISEPVSEGTKRNAIYRMANRFAQLRPLYKAGLIVFGGAGAVGAWIVTIDSAIGVFMRLLGL